MLAIIFTRVDLRVNEKGDFYEILFSVMNQKLQLCARYPAETRFVNMASRESAIEVALGKTEIFTKYASQTHNSSAATMNKALATLSLKGQDHNKVKERLLLYSNALVSKYLFTYQNTPDKFFDLLPVVFILAIVLCVSACYVQTYY